MRICRFVTISSHSMISPLHLCEVEVLTPLAAQVALAQCGEAAVQGGGVVYHNSCLVLQAQNKMNYQKGQEFCAEKGMLLLHNHTQADYESYEFVK